MENLDPNNSVQTITEPFPEVKDYLSLDQILPDTTGRSEPASFGSPILEPVPVSIEITASDRLFPGQIQEAIALSPPEPLPPPSPALPDPLIGNSAVVNQEAIASLGQPGNGVKVEYYDNPDLTRRVLTTIVPKIDFNWGDGSPDEAIAEDNFSARWTGKLQPDFTELYTFSIESDDAVQLWLDGKPVIDNASDPTDISGTIALEAGQLHDLILEYAHTSGDAAVELSWSSQSQPQEIIPLSAFFTPETRPDSSDDRDPERVQFFTKAFYNSGETVHFRGQVYAGDTDPDAIDFRLKKDGDEWIDISDATEFVPNSNNPGYDFFNYELSGLEPGRYQLQGSAIASSETSGTATQSFTVLDLGTQLPDSVLQAIARSVNLDNYSAEELASTQQWIVNLPVGESSVELATEFGARALGATGHIPNNYIWEFAEDADPREIASQLSESVAVQFAYPQVSVKLEPLLFPIFFPKDRLFEEQWHLNNTGQSGGEDGVDVNVTGAWDRATGNGIVIGIVDDGLQHTHPDLQQKYRPDLSRDFNEGDIETRNYDGDPAPFSQGLTFDAQLPGSVQLEDGEEIIQYVPFEGTVENLKVTLDIDHHPSPEELEVYLYSPNGTELELSPGDQGNEYTIDPEELENESSLGLWRLIIENDTRITLVLHDLSLTLDVWNSHGTPVAGVAAASGNNDLGVTGVAPDAELAGLRLIAADRVTDFQIADALYSELNRDIDIYNNSWKPEAFWSGPESMMALHQGVTDGRGGPGNIYVFGAGNDWKSNVENVNYNAFTNSRHTIAVGAIDNKGKKSDYSQQGPSLLVSAPSSNNRVGITTTDLVGPEGRNFNGDGEYDSNYPDLDYTNDFGGTSSATPVVSGAIALMLEANPSLTPRDIQHILVETANRDLIDDLRPKWTGSEGYEIRHSDKYGFGVVDAEAAVNAAASWTPVAEEVSFSTGMLTADLQIRDGDWKGVTQTIEISEDIAIEWVEVVLNITHELRSDLIIELTSPDGTTSVLANEWFEESESDAGYDNFVLTSVRHWGESSLGEWQLQVVDKRPFWSDETGTWDSWELKFYGTQPTTVEVEATDPNASEDNNPGEFTFTRTGGKLDRPLIVDYSVEGTAIAGEDYEALTFTVEIPAGESQAIVPVIPKDDGLVEENETVVLNLVPDISYAIGTNNSATVIIANNPPTLTLIDSLTGAREETSFTISYSDLMAKSDAVDADGDPIFLEISTIASGTLMKDDVPVEPGVTTLSEGEAVVWIPDTVGDEVSAFTVRAFDGIDYSSTEVPVKVAVTALPIVIISGTDANASEDGDAGEWTVTRSGDTTSQLPVSFSIAGDASAGTDYETIDNIIIPAGLESVKIPLVPIDDEEIEGDETVTVNLETDTGYKLGGDRSSSITIADNDFPNNPPTLTSIETLTDATEETPFTISYAQLRSASNVADADGDAISFQIDATASGTLQKNDIAVEPGVTTLEEGETVIWTPDTVGDEVSAFTVRAFDGIDYSSTEVPVKVAVTALPIVTISGTDANASEDGDAGEWTVTRSGDTTSQLPISFSIAGDAIAGTDYETIDNIIIPAGSSSVKIPLVPIDDEEIEGDETVTVNLETDTGYKLGDDRNASAIIADNDFAIDLESLALTTAATSLSAGDNFNVRFLAINNGPETAGPFNVAFYLSEDDTITPDDRLLGNYAVNQLRGYRNTGLKSIVLTLPDTGDAFWNGDGDYTLGMWVDSDNVISESDEDNNANTEVDKDYLTISISDTQLNQPPVAVDDFANTAAGTTVTIPVLSNDFDFDSDGDLLAITGVSNATSGEVDLSDNNLVYTPNVSFAGTDSFTYTLSDGQGGTNTATVNVTVEPSQIDLESLALTTAATSTEAGDNFNVRFLAINNGPETAGPFNVAFYLSEDDTITSDDRLLGNYTVSQLIGYRNTGLKSIALTLPDAGDAFWNGDGDYTLGMRVDSDNVISESDEDNNANTEVDKDYLTIDVSGTQLNQPPLAVNDFANTAAGTTVTIPVLSNDFDFDSDGDPLAITGVSTATSGEVDLSDNNLVYTPNVSFAGTDSFTYTLSDGQGGTDTATVLVTVEPPSSTRVTVTVNQVKAIDDMEQGLLGGSGEADFFTKLTINGQTWESPFKSNQNHIVPNWQFTQEVTDFTVPITINMHEHDGGLFGSTNDVDINPSGGVKRLNLLYDLRTGKISGDASGTRGEQIYVRGSGDSLRAEMWFTIGSDILLVQPNTAPTVPKGLNEVVNGNSVTLNWNRATDGETAPADLTYNLRVGTTPSGENIISPTSISPQLAQNGNVDRNNSWTLNNLEPGTYYWTVQAVDSAFTGSEFAPSGSFTVEPPPSGGVTVTVHRVKDVDGIDDISNFFTGSEADYFTRISINGQSWQSPQIKDEEDISPNWQFSQNVTAFTVPIVINLLDSDPFTDQQADINPLLGKEQLELTYNLLTGEIGGSGVSGTRGQEIYVRGQGGDERADIWFSIDSTFSEDSIPTNHWNAAFINRTNSNVDDRALYNFSNPEAVLDLGPASGDGKISLYQNWNASPASGVQSDYFAMQAWTRTNFAADKLYKITTKSDDGSWFRLQNVNTGVWTGNSVVEADDGADWRDRAIWNPPKTIMFKVPETGEYDLVAEFYDRTGEAVVDFTVEEVKFFSESVNESVQWQGQFFWWDRQEGNQPPTDIFAAGGDRNNAIAVVNLGNNTRNDGKKGLSFNWENGLPNNDARLPNENFAILATTETYFEAGRKYQARVRGDDGFQLLAQNLNSNELVYITPENNWAQSYGDHQEIDFTVPSDGQYDLQVQFYEERGDANFDLSWEPVNFTGRTIATTNTNVRSGPSRDFAIVGKLRNGTQVTFDKWTEGEFISYPSLGTASSLWYRIAGTNNWISAAIVDGSP